MPFQAIFDDGSVHTWTVTDRGERPVKDGTACVAFRADGYEMEYLLYCLSVGILVGLPYVQSFACNWCSPWAQFLWDNLPYRCGKISPEMRSRMRQAQPP